MDNRRLICGIFFWLKVLLAFLIAAGLLGFQSYQVYNYRVVALVKLKQQQDFVSSVGGTDDADQGLTVNIDPTNVVCQSTKGSILKNVTASSLTGTRHVVTQNNRLEPPAGVRLFGFALDFSWDRPTSLMTRMGNREPAVIAAFVSLNASAVDENMINWFAAECAKTRSMLELAILPVVAVDAIPDSIWTSLANILYRANSRHGIPILLRFASEMNGNWFAYGQRPLAFKSTWIKVTNLIRARTNMTAMMWGPNPGSGYPYGTGLFPPPAVGTAEFTALDTNGDGALTILDDPYGPYWPGADYVDWVGISMYNYNWSTTANQYLNPTTEYIVEQLSGPWAGVAKGAYSQDFYSRFVDTYAKPFAFTESGSAWGSTSAAAALAATTQAEYNQKQAWWTVIIKLLTDDTLYPNLKLVVQFEEAKFEEAITGVTVWKDFQLTNKTNIAAGFVSALQAVERPTVSAGPITWTRNLNYTCGGKVVLVV